MTRFLLIALASVVCLALNSCGDDVQLAKPPAKADPHGGARPEMPAGHPSVGGGDPAAAPGGNPHGAGGDQKKIDPHGTASADPFADEGGDKPGMGAAPKSDVDMNQVILAGELSLDPTVKLPAQYTVYIMAVFDPKERAGAMIRRIDGAPSFPIKFEMTPKDSPFGVQKFDRPLWVRGMISEGGDAIRSTNRTTSDQSYPVGTKGIKLTLKP